jgi:hypothetical protein
MRRDVLRSARWFLTEWKGCAVGAPDGGGGGVVVGEKAAAGAVPEKEMERLRLRDQRKDPTLFAVFVGAGSFDSKHADFFKRTGEVRTYRHL